GLALLGPAADLAEAGVEVAPGAGRLTDRAVTDDGVPPAPADRGRSRGVDVVLAELPRDEALDVVHHGLRGSGDVVVTQGGDAEGLVVDPGGVGADDRLLESAVTAL